MSVLFSFLLLLYNKTVQLDKTSTNNFYQPVKPDAKPSSQAAPPAAKPAAAKPAPASPAAHSPASIAAAAGLSADKLSSSIVAFARFFSASLKPETLNALRLQALAPELARLMPNQLGTGQGAPDAAAKARLALALAAAAAAGKGVELSPRGLEAYASAIDPELAAETRRAHAHERNPQAEKEGSAPGGGQGSGGRPGDERRGEDEGRNEKTGGIPAPDLEKKFLEAEESDPLLAILNRLPCKNGKRWIVLPLHFSGGGAEYSVSLRVLADEGPTADSRGCMVMDIAASLDEGGGCRRWLFVLESKNGQPAKLAVYLNSLPGESLFTGGAESKSVKAVSQQLSELLLLPAEFISVMNITDSFSFEINCGNELLRQVNVAV